MIKNLRVWEALGLSRNKLIWVETGSGLREVLGVLHANGILSLPVLKKQGGASSSSSSSSSHRVVGLVDLLDLVSFTARSFVRGQEAGVMDDNPQISPELFRQFEFEGKTVDHLLAHSHRSRDFKLLDKRVTLGELANALGCGDHHRVLIKAEEEEEPKLISQSDVVRYLGQHKDQLPFHLLNSPVGQLNLLHESVVHVRDDTTAIQAYFRLLRHGVSAIAILDNRQRLVGTLSASDLRGINDETLNTLTLPVREFLDKVQRKAPASPVRCSPDEKLDTVIDRLIQSRVHRLWITDENQKPVGVVALTDVIRTLLA
jgi:CBS domain-containing protein